MKLYNVMANATEEKQLLRSRVGKAYPLFLNKLNLMYTLTSFTTWYHMYSVIYYLVARSAKNSEYNKKRSAIFIKLLYSKAV